MIFAPGRWGLDLLVVGLIFVAYSLTLWVALDLSFGAALVGSMANTMPVVIVGALARWAILKWLAGRSVVIQLIGHAVVCIFFTLLSLWLLFILLGLVNGTSPIAFIVKPFNYKGVAWQSLEDVTIYGVIVAISYLQIQARQQTGTASNNSLAGRDIDGGRASEPESPRYFVRIGEDIRPIDLDTVVSIGGADDYAEVTLLDGKHLVRMTLAEFEQSLDAARFVRVHRSRIVNLDYVDRAEPAGGGRLLLHMRNGESLSTSRAGARLLRGRVI